MKVQVIKTQVQLTSQSMHGRCLKYHVMLTVVSAK